MSNPGFAGSTQPENK